MLSCIQNLKIISIVTINVNELNSPMRKTKMDNINISSMLLANLEDVMPGKS